MSTITSRPPTVDRMSHTIGHGEGFLSKDGALKSLNDDELRLLGLDPKLIHDKDFPESYTCGDFVNKVALPPLKSSGSTTPSPGKTNPLNNGPSTSQPFVTNEYRPLSLDQMTDGAGAEIQSMMNEALRLSQLDPKQFPDAFNQAQDLANRAANIQAMITKLIKMLADMQKAAIENMK